MLRDRLIQLLQPVVVGLGYQLWELEYAARSGGGLLRLYIDTPELTGAISVDDCERVSRKASAVLDAADPIPGEYTLEVSSPGLDRVLRTREHFVRFAGSRVQVEMTAAVDGRKRFTGRLSQVSEGALIVDVEGGAVRLPIDAIHKARLAPEF